MIVYLLHFKRPYVAGRAKRQHYIGLTQFLPSRLRQHGTSHGARFLQFVAAAGITWDVVREDCERSARAGDSVEEPHRARADLPALQAAPPGCQETGVEGTPREEAQQ
jgi:predicted GIY-YIG superfamily endonuclease